MRRRIGILALIAGLFALPATAKAAASGEVWTATLSGGAEVPPVATSATGSATFVLSPDGTTIRYLVQYSGLSDALAAAHIHLGAAGSNGGVMLPLAAGPSPMVGILDASDFLATGGVTTFSGAVDAIRAGTTYINLHTAANSAGELRGQVGVTVSAPQPTTTPAVTVPPTSTATTDPAAPAVPFLPTLAVLATAAGLGWLLAAAAVLRSRV